MNKHFHSTILLLVLISLTAGLSSQSIFINVKCDNQNSSVVSDYKNEISFIREQDILNNSDSLKYYNSLYGIHKDIPEPIKNPILVSLSFYPELSPVNIRFCYKSIRQTMNARPEPGNIFKSKKNRKYVIMINDNKGKYKGLQVEEMSFNTAIGWFGHELAHISEYERLSNLQTLGFAIKYVISEKFRRKVERYTDFLTITHGLGYPLYEGVEYLLNTDRVSESYKQNIKENYLSPEEIRCFCKP